ncbi:MAG: hypothetical protein WB622_12960 [Acidobacteriaceae bacterium]
MSSGRRIAAPALWLVLLTGCAARQPRAVAPPVAQIPSLPPARMAELVSPWPPDFPPVKDSPVKLDTTTPPEPTEEAGVVEPRHTPHRRTKPSEDAAQQETPKATAPAPPQVPAQSAAVAAAQPSEESPIGQLSTANDTSNTGDRHAISEQIDSTENGVNAVKRALTSDEQKTVAQIRIYISKARDALKADDLDAARTLSNKAHQLLEQLTKE